MVKSLVAIGLLGTTLDTGKGPERWEKWRPTISLFQHEDLLLQRFEMLYEARFESLALKVQEDIRLVSPETMLRLHRLDLLDPWDFEEVYGTFHDFARNYPFDLENEEYLVHITTGTHVEQICLFLLTESRHFPARLLQGMPPNRKMGQEESSYRIIDLDLSRYDKIASRFAQETQEALSFLKAGIETRNAAFNRVVEHIERVAIASTEPILLTGPTGAGKTVLARRIYELKASRRQVEGNFIEVNCATLRGDGAMSALFGHVKGSFTGAMQDRPGLLKAANNGLLFLDEIGELGLDEQAMLLRALECKRFLPVGSDKEAKSDFQLIAGTNRDLGDAVRDGRFREDLLCRIHLWTFRLPGLKERLEDIEPNLQFELDQFTKQNGRQVTFNREARDQFLHFATSAAAKWSGNFRDLHAAVIRMATFAHGGRINLEVVSEEIERLKGSWRSAEPLSKPELALSKLLGETKMAGLDRFDLVQLADVVSVCDQASNMSEAGRILFAISRAQKSSSNDADRLRKYLAKFDLQWSDIKRS